MALSASGFNNGTAQNIIIDSAVIFKDFSIANGTPTGTVLGATQGGVEINIEKKLRQIEIDGAFVMPVKGTEVVESEEATFTASLIELSTDMLKMALGGVSTPNSVNGYDLVEGKYVVEDGDYINGLAIVGNRNGSDKKIIFVFDNVLITSAFKLKMEDKSEGVVEISGKAHASVDQLQQRKSPWHIYNATTTVTPTTGG